MFRQLQLDQVNIYSFSLKIVAQVGLIDNVLILKKISEVKIGGNLSLCLIGRRNVLHNEECYELLIFKWKSESYAFSSY